MFPALLLRPVAPAVRSLLVGLLLALPAVRASAHAHVASAIPANGAQLDAPPAEIRLRFSEPVEPAFTSVALTDAAGHAVAPRDKAGVQGGDTLVLPLPLPALGHGRYRAHWTAVGRDGHRVHGDLDFTVR